MAVPPNSKYPRPVEEVSSDNNEKDSSALNGVNVSISALRDTGLG